MRSKIYLFFIVLLISIAFCTQAKLKISKDDTLVAKVGNDYLVTANDLRQYVKDWKYGYRFRIKSDAYQNALNGLIRDRLRVFDFFDRKLDENKDLMREISRITNNELMNAFFDKNFVDKYANEKAAAEAYKEMDKEIICIDIILPMTADQTKEMLDSLRMIALGIEADLSKDDEIDNLIKSYSLKSFNIKANRKVTWSESMIDPVANVIFQLQKGFTRVVESVDGFHIIKVLDIKKIKLEPFEKIKDEIISQLQKGFYWAYNNAYEDFRQGLVDKNSIKWNQSGLDQIVKWSSEDPRFYEDAYKDTIENTISNGNNFEILSYNSGIKVDLKEYLRLLEEIIILSPNTELSSVNVKDFILEAVYDNNIVMAAKKLGLEEKLINPNTENPILADRLLYLYNKTVIDGSIPETTPETLHKFYEDHKDSIFYQLKVVYIYARIYSDSSKAAADISEIEKGTSFEKVSNAWLVKMFIRERDGSLKAYRTAGGDYLAEAAFKLNLNECAGPIEYNDSTIGKQFAVIKCFQIQPEKQLTYDDVKGQRIEEEFKSYYRQRISDKVDARLKKKYSVKIYEDALSETISSK